MILKEKPQNIYNACDVHIKNDLYLQLTQKTINIKTKDSLIEILASNQKKIEETHFKHFQDIKNLCKPNQMNSFNELTEELSRIFGRKPKPRHD